MKYKFCIDRKFWQGSAITRTQARALANELADAIANRTNTRPRVIYESKGIDFSIDIQGNDGWDINPKLQIRFKNLDLSLRVSGTEPQHLQKSSGELSHFLDRQFNYSKLTEIAREVHGGYDD